MKKKLSFKIALGGLVSALSIICMFFTGVMPLLSYALSALAGTFLIVIVIELGKKWAFITYAAVSILSYFMTPDKEAAVLFTMLLGYYPIVKSFLEKIKFRPLEYLSKLALFNVSIILSYQIIIRLFGMTKLLDEFKEFGKYSIPVFLIAANIAFILYDIALTGVISTYINTFRPKIMKRL